jgi:hypothetical protein
VNSGDGIGAARQVSGIPNGFGRAICHVRFVVLSLIGHGTKKRCRGTRRGAGRTPESEAVKRESAEAPEVPGSPLFQTNARKAAWLLSESLLTRANLGEAVIGAAALLAGFDPGGLVWVGVASFGWQRLGERFFLTWIRNGWALSWLSIWRGVKGGSDGTRPRKS